MKKYLKKIMNTIKVFIGKNVLTPIKKYIFKPFVRFFYILFHNKSINLTEIHIVFFNRYKVKRNNLVSRALKKHLFKPLNKFFHTKPITMSYTHIVLFEKYKLKRTNKRRQALTGLSFIFLWIVGYLIFSLYPVFNSFYLSFFKVRQAVDGISTDPVLFNNYRAAFLSDTNFVEILINYSLSMLLNVPVTIVFALIIALLINQNIRGKGIWRTIFFLPVIIASGPVIGELMNQGATTLPSIENYQFIDLIVNNVGSFLADPIQALFDQILFVLWFAGIQILIFLAGLQKIDKSIYEASMIDGASPWEAFWKITLPSIKPLITISIIYTVVSMSVFSLNPVTVYIRGKYLGISTDALTTGYGYTATLSWIYFVVMVLIILIFVGALNIRGRKAK
ncbi:MAG: sugar ABC transporter permease [Tenericutes bacterium]|jgi:ABC-type sugar transport system permease subunit|nr:sugar ABC transporter permease [Mycoplasmatota bacterium]